jgi:hypothetical protein
VEGFGVWDLDIVGMNIVEVWSCFQPHGVLPVFFAGISNRTFEFLFNLLTRYFL